MTQPVSDPTRETPPSHPAAAAAAAVAATERSSRNASLLAAAAFLVMSVGFLSKAVFSGGAYLFRDILTFFHPWQHAVRESVLSGHLPLWNHDTYCGIPLLANLQSGVFYPVNWLYWVLPFDVALTAGMVVHLTLAGFLMRGFLRRVGLDQLAAFLGGALFAYGTWTLAYLEFPMKLGSAVWLPLMWSGIWEAMRNGRRRGLAWSAIAIALSVFGGYPQLGFFAMISATLFAGVLAYETMRDPLVGGGARLHRLGAWPVAVALGGLVAAVQLFPSGEMATMSSKATVYDPTVAMSRSLPPQGIFGFLDPFFLGFPGVDRYWGGEVVEFGFGTFYVGALGFVLALAAGPAFFLPRPPRRRVPRLEPEPLPDVPPVVPLFLGLGVGLGLLVALGHNTPLYPFLFEYVPGFARTRWPGTACFLVAAHLAPLAAVGLRTALTGRVRTRRTCQLAIGTGAFLVVLWALALGPGASVIRSVQLAGAPAYQHEAHEAARGAWLVTLALRGALLLAAGSLGLLHLDRRPRIAVAWTALLLFDLLLVWRSFEAPVARGFYATVPESVKELADELDGRRVFTPRATDQLGNFLYGARNPVAFEWAKNAMLCNANVPAGIAQAHGCEPLNPRRHEAFVQVFASDDSPWELKERIFDLWDAALLVEAPEVGPLEVPRLDDAGRGLQLSRHEPRLGRAMLVTGWETFDSERTLLDVLLSREHDPSFRTLIERGEDGLAPRNPARVSFQPGEILSHEAGPNSIHVAWVLGPAGFLRILESWDPGWQAIVNGVPAPVYRADFVYMAIPVPEGPCEVRLQYRPRSLRAGLGLAALGLLGIALCLCPFPSRRS